MKANLATKLLATKRDPEAPLVLSVNMIVRNCEKADPGLLEQCLISIRQRVPNAEIVIVDTCSSDGTPEIAKRYADVFEEYKGPKGTWTKEMFAFDDAAAARNRVLALSHGEWIMWVDSDDWLPPAREAEKLLKLNGYWKPGKTVIEDAPGQDEPIGLEELLTWLLKEKPDTDAIICPYLYEATPDGAAITWQVRERIVRNNGKFVWKRPAHEVLVPDDPRWKPKTLHLPHLLVVHKKKHTSESRLYSLKRHYDILIKEYEAGHRACQDLLYLENFSRVLCPNRRQEFIHAAYESSTIPSDRMRVMICQGIFAAENGLYMDAVEAFHAAVALRPDLPDGWAAGGKFYEDCEDWLKAADWYARASECTKSAIDSEVSPRDQEVTFRSRAAVACRKIASRLLKEASPAALTNAKAMLNRACDLMKKVMDGGAAGNDLAEAGSFLALLTNESSAIDAARGLETLMRYLIDNDETEKAAWLAEIVPHNLEDSPIAQKLEALANLVTKHLNYAESYAAFYNELEATGMVFAENIEAGKSMARVQAVIRWAQAEQRELSILEVGAFDGITAVPVLQACPNVKRYVAIETSIPALEHLKSNAEKYKVQDRLEPMQGTIERFEDKMMLTTQGGSEILAQTFDAVIFYEVIEHVPLPEETIKELLQFLKPGGKLLISTPFGSFDTGLPPDITWGNEAKKHDKRRDPRGHVRAFSMRDFYTAARLGGGRFTDLCSDVGVAGRGVTQFGAIEALPAHKPIHKNRPVAFFVPSALWDWNASVVLDQGMGASESQIVHVAAQLAKEHAVEVYGPMPSDYVTHTEVRDAVGYWKHEQLRLADPRSRFIVSRAPSARVMLPEKCDPILWLQDAWYGDLNPDTAKKYDKIVCVSEWHKQTMAELHGVPEQQMTVIPNGIIPEWFSGPAPERDPHRFIYASSPDRGLITLLRMWPKIRAMWPDASLCIFYGWRGALKLGSTDPAWTAVLRSMRPEYQKLVTQPGVFEFKGMIPGFALAQEMRKTGVWAYPTHFAETGCTVAVEARAAGCVTVTTPYAGLNESAPGELTGFVRQPEGTPGVAPRPGEAFDAYVDQFVGMINLMTAKATPELRQAVSEVAKTEWPVSRFVKRWEEVL